ncbi:methyltransferase domain-containing protein [Nitratiruptor sp. YY09-18]|uniref:methyltransferase domain-containing protein n=1 Tax=Nitratiruptor sp. YY09-18 TaxID=2724901 RepID=UPI001915CD7A|nr:methyltransferase domain-containing protein [Nitratiruptor sp. YY09-18]BCD68916.1 malonyl-CoA O-methyltransferase [Nitratiruptor sp. YY09-18]
MKHIKEFDRFAQDYQKYKIIQSKVAKHLVDNSPYKGRFILDIGAGSGEVYHNIDWEYERFYALDLSSNMLQHHPRKNVETILCDFDEGECWEKIAKLHIDEIFASSSLQWSKDLDQLFWQLKTITPHINLALFTSKTFATMHAMLGISSPIRDAQTLLNIARKYFKFNYEVRQYKLFFSKTEDIFRYIKKSGVSSGYKRAKIGALRRLMREYPYNYLEFEVVFIWSKSS